MCANSYSVNGNLSFSESNDLSMCTIDVLHSYAPLSFSYSLSLNPAYEANGGAKGYGRLLVAIKT